jgi:hypothetical protein
MSNNHYLLRDSNEIFGIYTSIEIAYNHLLQFLYNLQRYHKIITGSTCSIKPIISNFQIIQYEDNSVINLYNLNSNFNLVDINLKQLNFTKPSIIDFISKLEIGSRLNVDTNDLSLFIPINFTETEIKNIVQPRVESDRDKILFAEGRISVVSEEDKNSLPLGEQNFAVLRDADIAKSESDKSSSENNYSASEVSKELQELQAKIALLDAMKHNERTSLDKIKENIKSKEEQVFLEKVKTETIKQKIEQKKEYYDKTKAKFKIDKDIYFKIKKEIQEGERHPEKLPELFVEEYKIFSKMELENMLDLETSDDAFKEYIKHKPEKKKNFATVFDNIFDNDNWGNKNFIVNKDTESDDDSDPINFNSDSDDSNLEINRKRNLFVGF